MTDEQEYLTTISKEEKEEDGTQQGLKEDMVTKRSIFFIIEFAGNKSMQDLSHVFTDFGEINEVIIPPKRDKRERKYRFVRFFNVRDERTLTKKLDNTLLMAERSLPTYPNFKENRLLVTKGNVLLYSKRGQPTIYLKFFVEEDELSRFKKAYIRVMENSGLPYSMQKMFHLEGYLFVKVTPLGAYVCFLEES
ncbi:unnamed protein product [Vicia faba]|uniref:RRM domain-containing protein n=1 Tax=Vicia faba TaxID=3906 RepID=A0AAV1B1V9_VICFA|nr:unnamed protein product [Vicia faba]